MKIFAIIDFAGYIALRHLHAIKETKNNLVSAPDPSDNLCILDKFFPETAFSPNLEDWQVNKRLIINHKLNY